MRIAGNIDRAILKKAKSYLDWLEMVQIYNPNFAKTIDVNYIDLNSIKEDEIKTNKTEIVKKDIPVSEKTKELLNFEYNYKDLTKIESKTSVSKISKKASFNEDITLKKPKFIEKKDLSKAEIGTAIHLVLQKLNIKEAYNIDKIKSLLEELRYKNILTEAEKQAIDVSKIFKFTQSKLYKRIEKAKEVYREKPFYINIPANILYETDLKENVLVQGIIDLYFVDENGKIVLVDYKTDFVKEQEELIAKYKEQLMLYKKAIEEALDKTVDEVYIYSTYLNKEINIV